MLNKQKVKTWINTLTNKIRKPPKTQGLHIPIQYIQQRTITKPIPPKPILDLQPKRKKRYLILKGFSGIFFVLNASLGVMSLLTNPSLALFFLLNSWLLVYAFKYMERKT